MQRERNYLYHDQHDGDERVSMSVSEHGDSYPSLPLVSAGTAGGWELGLSFAIPFECTVSSRVDCATSPLIWGYEPGAPRQETYLSLLTVDEIMNPPVLLAGCFRRAEVTP